MKLFQIITTDGQFDGKFDVKFDSDEIEEYDEEVVFKPSIENLNIVYCCGDKWCRDNPTSISENRIKEALLSKYDKVYLTIKEDEFIVRIFDEEVLKDRIYIRKEDREIYEAIRKNDGDLKGVTNMDVFLIAMVLGFRKKGRHGLKNIKSTANDGLVRIESFTDDAWNMIKSFAVYEEEYMEVLLSNNKMFDVAEKYAIVGIQELNDLYFENEHNFLKRMENLLKDEFKFQNIGVVESEK